MSDDNILRPIFQDAAVKHYGPGNHPDGSSQQVHGGNRLRKTQADKPKRPHVGTILDDTPEDDEFAVHITAWRGPDDPEHVLTPRQNYERLRELAGKMAMVVDDVHLAPARGGWEGGWEPSSVITYKGNGAALRLLAEFGERHNQDGILVVKEGGSEKSFDIAFSGYVDGKKEAVEATLSETGIGGWTWLKTDGKTTLRLCSVPEWDANLSDDQIAQVAKKVAALGLKGAKVRPWASTAKLMTHSRYGESPNSYSVYRQRQASKHAGPGNHPSGSPQSVHGGKMPPDPAWGRKEQGGESDADMLLDRYQSMRNQSSVWRIARHDEAAPAGTLVRLVPGGYHNTYGEFESLDGEYQDIMVPWDAVTHVAPAELVGDATTLSPGVEDPNTLWPSAGESFRRATGISLEATTPRRQAINAFHRYLRWSKVPGTASLGERLRGRGVSIEATPTGFSATSSRDESGQLVEFMSGMGFRGSLRRSMTEDESRRWTAAIGSDGYDVRKQIQEGLRLPGPVTFLHKSGWTAEMTEEESDGKKRYEVSFKAPKRASKAANIEEEAQRLAELASGKAQTPEEPDIEEWEANLPDATDANSTVFLLRKRDDGSVAPVTPEA